MYQAGVSSSALHARIFPRRLASRLGWLAVAAFILPLALEIGLTHQGVRLAWAKTLIPLACVLGAPALGLASAFLKIWGWRRHAEVDRPSGRLVVDGEAIARADVKSAVSTATARGAEVQPGRP